MIIVVVVAVVVDADVNVGLSRGETAYVVRGICLVIGFGCVGEVKRFVDHGCKLVLL